MTFVQFNLLPDVKLEFNRAQRTKRIAYALSILAVSVVLVIFILAFLAVDVVQKKQLSDANNDITTYSNKLKSIQNLDKILTIQNQLGALPSLHQSKHITSRLFTYLPQITPANINLGKLTLDTSANTIELVGTADTVQTVNKFVDTIKFTTYTTANNTTAGSSSNTSTSSSSSSSVNSSSVKAVNAFTNVVLSKVDRNDKGATYTIDFSFDPALFSAANSVQLSVPQEITTRSVLNAPNPVFNGDTGTTTNQQGSQ